jgi:hypothetical protein
METNQEHRDRVIRMETELHHVAEKVDVIEERQVKHELNTNKSFEALRENALRLQIMSENLLASTREQNTTQADKVEKLTGRVTNLEYWRWYILGATAAVIFIAEKAIDFFGK